MRAWIRTCQECGKWQYDNHDQRNTDRYMDRKCKYCKSMALDYGKWQSQPDDLEENDQ